jgi:hypothetical protein
MSCLTCHYTHRGTESDPVTGNLLLRRTTAQGSALPCLPPDVTARM